MFYHLFYKSDFVLGEKEPSGLESFRKAQMPSGPARYQELQETPANKRKTHIEGLKGFKKMFQDQQHPLLHTRRHKK